MILVAAVLGAVFAYAAAAKAVALAPTRAMLSAFGIPAMATPLIAVEALTAVLLSAAPAAGAASALVLLAGFTVAAARVLRRGERPVCRCFGQVGEAPIGAGTLARNAVLAAAAAAVLLSEPDGWASGGLAVAGLAAVAAVAMARRPARLPRGLRQPGVLVFTDPECEPCRLLAAQLPRWGVGDEVRTTEDARARRAARIAATPAGVRIGADGRIGPPAYGAAAIEALTRGVGLRARTLEAWGVAFAVEGDVADALLPPGTVASSRTPSATFARVGDALYRDGVLDFRHTMPGATDERLAAQVRLHVAEHAPRHAFVHAGVVAVDGRAVIVPGRSHTGKSTLAAALVRAGAEYLSDEYAILDEDGVVHPYGETTIALRGGDGRQVDTAIERFAPRPAADGPRPLGAIILAPYAPGATWAPDQVSPGSGVLALLDNCVGARRDPRRVMATLRRAAEAALVLEGARGDADETAQALVERLSVAVA